MMRLKSRTSTLILLLALSLSTQLLALPKLEEGIKGKERKFRLFERNRAHNTSLEGAGWQNYFPYQPTTGYIDIYGDKNNSMFYWLSPARENPETAPVIIWLEGGPGGSSVGSLFEYLGPLHLKDFPKIDKMAKIRKISWNQKAHVVFPDYPIGVGFSTNTQEHNTFTAKDVKFQMLKFYQGFLQEHPELKGRPVYVAGESYAGHSVPYTATALKYSGDSDINIRGIFITSGFMNAKECYNSYLEFALLQKNYTKFTQADYQNFSKLRDLCVYRLKIGPNQLYQADLVHSCDISYYNQMIKVIKDKNPNFTIHYMPGGHKTDKTAFKFLNVAGVQKSIKARKSEYLFANDSMYDQMYRTDIRQDSTPLIGKLLDDGVQAVIVDSELDFDCNYLQAEVSINMMEWSGKQAWSTAVRKPCGFGLCKEYRNLKEIRVPLAGHGVSLYQPQIGLDIVNDLMFGDAEVSE